MLSLPLLSFLAESISQFSGACWSFDLVVGGSWSSRCGILVPCQTGPRKGSRGLTIAFSEAKSVERTDDGIFLFHLKLNHKGSRGLTIAGGCSCVSGLGLLGLLPQLELDADDGKAGSEMLAAAVPALLGVGDGLINLQVLL